MILLDKTLVGIVLTAAGTLLLLFLRFAKDERERFWSIRFLNFAEKLQPEENVGLLSRRMKRD